MKAEEAVEDSWVDAAGRVVTLVAVDTLLVDSDGEAWFAEEPGVRPPQNYQLVAADGSVVEAFTVFPLAPWSAWDAAADRLDREGWVPRWAPEVRDCPHGLSADLCYGPDHYA